MSSLSISPQVFAILSALVEERLGLHYGPDDASVLADKLTPRALERGFDSLLDYYYFLRYDERSADELDALADALVVNETFFFREVDQLGVLADILVARGRRSRVWCAACSTGEEPSTLAMLLSERGHLDQVEILATDVSQRALSRARAGVYRGRSLRSLPEAYAQRFFTREEDSLRLVPLIRGAIQYRQVNLLDELTVRSLGAFDAILCRNVLIYFHDDLVRRLAQSLAQRLNVGGLLLVGASESLLRFGTSLACIERGGVFLYQRAEP